jgi:predicted RNA-binding Zn ribbon-like protein
MNRMGNRRRPPQFDLIGGNVCLDFINTLDDRHMPDSKETLKSYADLARFSEDTGLLSRGQAEALLADSLRSPEKAEAALSNAKKLRETMHEIFWAVIQKRAVSLVELERLDSYLQRASSHLRLKEVDHHRFELRFNQENSLESILWLLARGAGELLTSDHVAFVRACGAKDCEWFFLDTSKNHRRRWCDMKRCGNRAKARRSYERMRRRKAAR